MERKHKTGRVPKVSLDKQKNVYVQFMDVFQGVVPPLSHSVYGEIARLLDYKMSVKSIQVSLKKNYEYIFESSNNSAPTLTAYNLVSETSPVPDLTVDYDDDIESSPLVSHDSNSDVEVTGDKNSSSLTFEIDVTTWKEIEPKLYYYRRNDKQSSQSVYNAKRRLQRNKWTYIIQEQLWKNAKLVCTWNFKYNYAKDNYEVTCKGYCKQCRANIIITTHRKSDNFVGVTCKITNLDKTFQHSSDIKNQVRGHRRSTLSEQMRNESALAKRHALAADLMNEGDKEPSVLPKLGTLRQIKHERNQSVQLHPNPILSLVCMASTPPYDECIRNVSAYPFYVYYWTNEQIAFYKDCQKTLNYVRLSIDATGSIFCKKLRPVVNEHTKLAEEVQGPLFFYVAMTDTVVKSSIPVAQMISETHSLDDIRQWLKSWLANGKSPNEVVTDDSAALIGAVVQVFAGKESTNKYLLDCFALLEKLPLQKVPNCYVRLDSSHFIKTLYNQELFKNVDYRVKIFYIKCILLIKRQTSYEEVKRIIKDLTVVANCKYRGIKENQQTMCEISLRKLRHVLQDDSIQDSNKNQEIMSETDKSYLNDEEQNMDQNPLIALSQETLDKINVYNQLTDDGKTEFENLYYLPVFITFFMRILKKTASLGERDEHVFQKRRFLPF